MRKYPHFQGGFIWDFVDQGLRGKNKQGKQIYTYGGDYGRYPATDHNFNCNGLFNPDREAHPHADEVRYYYQNVWTTLKDSTQGVVEVYNENFFRTLDNLSLNWTLLCNGQQVAAGTVADIHVAPQSRSIVQLEGFKLPQQKGEYVLQFDYRLKKNEPLLKAGYVVARQEMVLSPYIYPTLASVKSVVPIRAAVVGQRLQHQR